jgi:ADP-ribose pyrophosphatase YjhB (NUDIX family)
MGEKEGEKIKREFSAGGAVFKKLKTRSSKPKILWLVSKSKPGKLYPQLIWRLPKGWLDDRQAGKKPGPLASGEKRASEQDIKTTALREVVEEGGVKANIVKRINTEKIFFRQKDSRQKVLKFITYFLMEWRKDVGYGSETSEVRWLPYLEARRLLTYNSEKKILDKAKRILDMGIQ